MKNLSTFLILFILLSCSMLTAQSGIDWLEKPTISTLPDSLLDEKVVYVYLGNNLDFRHSDEGQLLLYYTYYRKVRILDDEYINQFNKINISLNNTIEIEDIKARSINPDGSIIEFNRDNIKEIEDDENDGTYQIFAIDGVENGSEVEVYYRKKMNGQNFGGYYYQYSYPVLEGHFELTSPTSLHYKLKGYNGLSGPVSKPTEEFNCYRIEVGGIDKLKEEEYAYWDPRRSRVEYRLDINENRGRYPLLTWNDAAARVYELMFGLEKSEQKALEKFVAKFDLNTKNKLDAAKAIESYIKTTINLQEYNIPEFMDLEYVIKNGVSGPQGHTRLYANIFIMLGIKYNIVMTSPRDQKVFDPDFESWNYLDKYLIYLPDYDEYLNPGSFDDRIGYVDGLLRDTWGLRIDPVKIRNVESAIGTPFYIKSSDYKINSHNTYVELSIDTDEGSAIVETEDCFRGLGGGILKDYYDLIEDENKDDFLKEILLVNLPSEDFISVSASTETVNDKENSPDFCISYTANTRDFLEFAGNNIIVKIGETIGPQVEMYQQEERISDVVNDFNRWYWREINFKIPDGYKIKNPDAARFDIVFSKKGEKIFGFESDYNIEGNIYTIIVDEYYKEVFLEKEHFEEFRKVVNAAADFNKVVLVLEKIN